MEGVLKNRSCTQLVLQDAPSVFYELLQRVREQGDWEAWLEFFLTGISERSEQAADTAKQILALFEADRIKIQGLGRPAASALRVHTAPTIKADFVSTYSR